MALFVDNFWTLVCMAQTPLRKLCLYTQQHHTLLVWMWQSPVLDLCLRLWYHPFCSAFCCNGGVPTVRCAPLVSVYGCPTLVREELFLLPLIFPPCNFDGGWGREKIETVKNVRSDKFLSNQITQKNFSFSFSAVNWLPLFYNTSNCNNILKLM